MSIPRYRLPPEFTRGGYANPPKAYQFSPGQSGNPLGRPKVARSLESDLLEELGELVLITEGGRTRQITKQRALAKSMVTKGIRGETKSAKIVVDLIPKDKGRIVHPDNIERTLSPDDEEIIEEFLKQSGLTRGG